MSRCPDCNQAFSHEAGHDCSGPRAVLVILRRFKVDPGKPPRAWKPVSVHSEADGTELPDDRKNRADFAIERLRAKHPRCEFKFQWYLAD